MKGSLSLVSAICSQRTAVIVYVFYIQRLLSLLPVLFTKDRGPCLVLFIWKGLLSLSFAIHLQRPLSLSFCYSFAKDCCPCPVLFTCKGLRPCLLLFIRRSLRSLSSGIHLQRTAAVLVLCHSFAKDCCCPCLVPFVCKGLRSLSCAINL